jgi:wyosine [tRNA(Phe)-imidazoG37] synthetase (radical SAM superfamily)
MILFGPVPSRRLGRSLGINNIPPKICTYACVYCQLGRTLKLQAHRQAFYGPEDVRISVQDRATKAGRKGQAIDYLTFVPDGEPTLDINLGVEIERLFFGTFKTQRCLSVHPHTPSGREMGACP